MGYNVVALSHTLSGKLPGEIKCPIPAKLPFKTPSNLRILRRCTLILSDASQNHRLASLQSTYDLLALRPVDEKTFMQACQTLDCDIISLDLSQRFNFYFKFTSLSVAIEQGKRFEICYSTGVGGDAMARRNLISNATQLIRASRGRGLIISSEAKNALACRGPWDVVNLAAVWGLGQERGHEAITKETRTVVVTAGLRRTSYRGAVDVIYGGEKPPERSKDGKKAGITKLSTEPAVLSKRQLKKQAHEARLAERGKTQPTANPSESGRQSKQLSSQGDRGMKRKSEEAAESSKQSSLLSKKQKSGISKINNPLMEEGED